jgi:hypothetical protein
MLADLERTYLKDKDSLDDKQKKNLNHRIKNKLKLIDETLNDVRLILENYPEELVKEHITNNTVYSAAAALERVLQILDPWSVGEHEEGELRAFRVWGSIIPTCPPGKCTIDSASRTASKEEINLHERLKEHFNMVRLYIDPCIPDPVCRDPEYSREQMDRLRQTTQRPFSMSFNAYLDETGVSESGWVLRAPTMLDIDQLQWMRWHPRGLKKCMELPPLLATKKIPRGSEIMHSRVECDAEGTHYLISEKGGEERSATNEEFLEANEKYGTIKRIAGTPLQSNTEQKEEPK